MELKQCPFCSGVLEEFEYSYFIDHKKGCFLGTKSYAIRSIRKFNSRGKKSTYGIRKWNTRTERTCRMVEAYCSECGKPDPSCGDAKYCAYCGAKVVGR